MKQALGLVEIQGLSTAIVVADTMSKAANVRILEVENTRGLGYMTIKIAGDVGAVNAAVNAGCQVGRMNQKLVSWKVIARPSNYVEDTFCNPTPPKQPSPPKNKRKTETADMQEKPAAAVTDAEVTPVQPDKPAEPEQPKLPVKPKAPEKSKTPEKPKAPGKPKAPAKPKAPEIPAEEEKPAEQDNEKDIGE